MYLYNNLILCLLQITNDIVQQMRECRRENLCEYENHKKNRSVGEIDLC